MSKRKNTPTVAAEPSERHFDEREDTEAAAPVETPAPAAAKAPPRPRRVSAEAVKAETRLANIQRASQASIAACLSGWAKKRADFIATLPHDVQGMLLAGGVITDDDLEGLPDPNEAGE